MHANLINYGPSMSDVKNVMMLVLNDTILLVGVRSRLLKECYEMRVNYTREKIKYSRAQLDLNALICA